MMIDTLKIGLVQLASSSLWNDNLTAVRQALDTLRNRCHLAVFPENILCLGSGKTVLREAREFNELRETLGALCADSRLAAIFGGVPLRAPTTADRALNSSLAFDADGHLLARYDKMHLFQLDPELDDGIDETRTYVPGASPAHFVLHGWTIALSICYDLRFPELYRAYAGSDLMVCTAAFTERTGKAHWEVLLRARAIENLCFVAGVGQCGSNAETAIRLYGHSLVADPWGTVIETLDRETQGLQVVPLNADIIQAARKALPALDHRHPMLTPGETP